MSVGDKKFVPRTVSGLQVALADEFDAWSIFW